MATQIQVGDLVKLHGSNVTMTVNTLYDNDIAHAAFAECLWFVDHGDGIYGPLSRDHFAVAALEKL